MDDDGEFSPMEGCGDYGGQVIALSNIVFLAPGRDGCATLGISGYLM